MRFGFDVLELRKFKLSVKSKATGTPLKGVFKAPALSLGISMPCVNVGRLSYIGVGLSALLVSTGRAMREPRYVERVTGLAPRLNQNNDCNTLIINADIL